MQLPRLCAGRHELPHAHFTGVKIYQRRERQYSVCFYTQVFLGPKESDRQSEGSRSFCILRPAYGQVQAKIVTLFSLADAREGT